MRILLMGGFATALAGCAPATMAGFDEIARAGGEQLTITVPAWKNGTFRVGQTSGTVRREDRRDAMGWGRDRGTGAYDAVGYGVAARYGRYSFAIERADLGGLVEARCAYAREELRRPLGGFDTATPLVPLRLRCSYRIAGAEAGQLDLAVPHDPRAALVDGRAGWITLGAAQVQLHSQHRLEGLAPGMGTATGYLMTGEGDRTLGALDLTGGQASRAILTDPATRAPALLAAITLALFWDPGDAG